MIEFEQSRVFVDWLNSLSDTIGKARITARIRAAEHGNFGDTASVGDSVFEMRVHHGRVTGFISVAEMKWFTCSWSEVTNRLENAISNVLFKSRETLEMRSE